MKATELRLGNIVDKGIVNGIRYNMGMLGCDIIESQFNSFSKWFDYRDVQPILLTEEWLMKFDFEDNDFGWWELFKFANEFTCYFSAGVIFIEQYSEGMFPLKHIKYVHQLQNLHHSLTQKELKL